MKFETRQKLLEEYQGLTNPKETAAIKYCKNRTDLPFLSGFRKVPMSSKMFNTLRETMGIKKKKLKELQDKGITLVRTADPRRRKKLTVVLESVLKK